ncbi:MAG: SxtJ family membrane protein [Archangium sp.]
MKIIPTLQQRVVFGLIFLCGFALLGRSLIFVAIGAVPLVLTPITPISIALYRGWMALGRLLSRVTTPVLMLIIYALVITPVALLSRLFGRDPLRLRPPKNATSYWEPRAPSDPASYLRQY